MWLSASDQDSVPYGLCAGPAGIEPRRIARQSTGRPPVSRERRRRGRWTTVGRGLTDCRAMRGTPITGVSLRAARAVPFATVCLLVSGLGHSLAGGGAPPLHGLLLGGLAVLVAAMALAGRERSLPVVAGALTAGEFGLHLWFHHLHQAMSGGAMAGMPGMGDAAALSPLDLLASKLLCGPLPAGMTSADLVRMAGLDPAAYSDVAPHLPATASGWLGITPGMALGHLAAALVAGWWLRRGEAACRALLGLALVPLRFALALLFTTVPGTAGPSLRPPRRDHRARRLPAAVSSRGPLVRRGPPMLLAA